MDRLSVSSAAVGQVGYEVPVVHALCEDPKALELAWAPVA